MADGNGGVLSMAGQQANFNESQMDVPGPVYPVKFPHSDYGTPSRARGMGGRQCVDDKNAAQWTRTSQGWIIFGQTVTGTWDLTPNYTVQLWEAGGANVGVTGGTTAIGSNIPYGQSLVETDASKQGATVGNGFHLMVGAAGFQMLMPFLGPLDMTTFTAKNYSPVSDFYAERAIRAIAENLYCAIVFADSSCNTILGRADGYGVHAGIQGGKVEQIGRGVGYSNVFPMKRASYWGAQNDVDKPTLQLGGPPVPIQITADPTMPIPSGQSLIVPIQGYVYGPRIVMCKPACPSNQVIPA